MLEKGFINFAKNKKVKENNIQILFEITLSNLKSDGEVNDQDFLDRADILCSLGYTVMISNYKKYYKGLTDKKCYVNPTLMLEDQIKSVEVDGLVSALSVTVSVAW